MQEMVLTAAQEELTTHSNMSSDLQELLRLLTSDGLIRSKHQARLDRHETEPARFALPRMKRSFEAVVTLNTLCTPENVMALITGEHITPKQLQEFIGRTPLSDCMRSRIEKGVRDASEDAQRHLAREHGAPVAGRMPDGFDVPVTLRMTDEPRFRRGVQISA